MRTSPASAQRGVAFPSLRRPRGAQRRSAPASGARRVAAGRPRSRRRIGGAAERGMERQAIGAVRVRGVFAACSGRVPRSPPLPASRPPAAPGVAGGGGLSAAARGCAGQGQSGGAQQPPQSRTEVAAAKRRRPAAAAAAAAGAAPQVRGHIGVAARHAARVRPAAHGQGCLPREPAPRRRSKIAARATRERRWGDSSCRHAEAQRARRRRRGAPAAGVPCREIAMRGRSKRRHARTSASPRLPQREPQQAEHYLRRRQPSCS